jgi:hypothetical protein
LSLGFCSIASDDCLAKKNGHINMA